MVKYADLKDKSMITDDERARRDFEHEMRRTIHQNVKKFKTPYIDLDPKMRVLEFPLEDMSAPAVRDNKSSMTTSKSQQQPSAGGTTSQPTGQAPQGSESASGMKDSSHLSISEKNLSVSGMLKTESEMSLRDEGQQADEDLPEDLLKPLKILERLLAQSSHHKQQVWYKNYPIPAAPKPQEEKKDNPASLMLESKDNEEQKKRAEDLAREGLTLF